VERTIAFINQKGGVGKTTATANITAELRRRGKKTLMIDLDPQGNLTYIAGANGKKAGVFELLTQEEQIANVIQSTKQGDIIAASADLATEGILSETGKEYRLKEAIEPLQCLYEYILIDCSPSLGILTINALTAATGAIIPMQADILSLQALGQFNGTLEAVRKYTNKNLKLYGIVLTRYNGRAVLSQEAAQMIEQTAKQLGTKVYRAPIRENIAVKEAQAARMDIFTHAPKSHAAADFEVLTTEILKDMEG
jgi:chromosome partitioning protein